MLCDCLMSSSLTTEDLDYLDFRLKFSNKYKEGSVKSNRNVREYFREKGADLERD
jgi:hypothetical protein